MRDPAGDGDRLEAANRTGRFRLPLARPGGDDDRGRGRTWEVRADVAQRRQHGLVL